MSYTVLRTVRGSRVATGPWAMAGLGSAGFGGLGALDPATNVYTVEQGDYVGKIAQKMGCAGGARELINANPGKNLGSGKIYAGNQIAIPPSCSGYVQPQPVTPPQPQPGYPDVPVGPITTPPIPGPQYPSTPSPIQSNPIPQAEWGLFGLGTTETILLGLGAVAVVGTGLYFVLKDDKPSYAPRSAPVRDTWLPPPPSRSGMDERDTLVSPGGSRGSRTSSRGSYDDSGNWMAYSPPESY